MKFKTYFPESPDIESLAKMYLQGIWEQKTTVTNPPQTTQEEAEYMVNQSSIEICIDEDENIVGFALFSTPNESKDGMAILDFIYAVEKRSGIGSELMSTLQEHLKKLGWKGIRLEVSSIDERPKSFYKSFGFKKVGTVNRGFSLDVMEKDI